MTEPFRYVLARQLRLGLRERRRLMLGFEEADLLANKMVDAIMRVVSDYEHEDVVGEEAFSEQLCGRLKETLSGFATETIQWQADTATAERGRGRLLGRSLTKWKEEPELGADLVMVLDVDTPEFSVKKGYLAQAKRLENGQIMDRSEHKRLIEQCDKMLSVTPACMVFLYSSSYVHVIPAAAITQYKGRNLYDIATYPLHVLYRDFAICWFGDPRIQATNRLALEGLRERLDAHAAIRLDGQPRFAGEMGEEWSGSKL